MENTTTMKIDLGIQAQQIASQVMVHNESIQTQIIKGIEQAIEEISDEDGFIEAVKESTKMQQLRMFFIEYKRQTHILVGGIISLCCIKQ